MMQDELWRKKWRELMDFLETNHRRPSKFIPEERNMRSWWKYDKKLLGTDGMKEDRVALFNQLLKVWGGIGELINTNIR